MPPPVALPLQRHRRIASGGGNGAGSKIRVLVIDDHQFVRRGLAAMIDGEPDMECCGAVDAGSVALTEIVRRKPDLVMIDVSLRRGAGLELVQRIRRRHPQVRIVAIGMYQKPDDVAQVFHAGAETCVRKLELAPRVLRAIRQTHTVRHRRDGVSAVATRNGGHRAAPLLEGIEAEIAEMIGRGAPGRAIAVQLGLSLPAIEAYRRAIRAKLAMPTATQFVDFCVSWVQRRPARDASFCL